MDQLLANSRKTDSLPAAEPAESRFRLAPPGAAFALLRRLLDIGVAVLALIALAPLLAAAAIAVRLSSPGPLVFSQLRLGKGGRPFRLLKFRTMIHNAPDVRNADGSAFTGDADPRVTAIGRWLRRTSLDELPQLINVLRGEMSIVGPRPDQADQLRFYTAADHRKLDVRPGLTGLAQISGRNAISWQRRKELDVVYVEQQSLRFDLAIIAKTIPYVLLRRDVAAPAGTDGGLSEHPTH